MTIDGLQTVVVTDDNKLSVTRMISFIPDDAYLTRESSADGVADIDLDVETFVLASPACTEV